MAIKINFFSSFNNQLVTWVNSSFYHLVHIKVIFTTKKKKHGCPYDEKVFNCVEILFKKVPFCTKSNFLDNFSKEMRNMNYILNHFYTLVTKYYFLVSDFFQKSNKNQLNVTWPC